MIPFLTDRPAWRDQAACRGVDPALFYPEVGEPGTEAKAVCAKCPVRSECLAFALDNREGDGIWGGVSSKKRMNMRRGRPRGARLCGWEPCRRPFTPSNSRQVYCAPACAGAAASAVRAPRKRAG